MKKNFLEVAEQQMEIARCRDEADTPVASAIAAVIQYLRDQEAGVGDVKFEFAPCAVPTGPAPTVKSIADKLAKCEKLQAVVDKLGSWASAAQDDPNCCPELKAIFNELLGLAVPLDFCTSCGANVPPIIGEGTCNKCEPFGFLQNPQLNDTVKLNALVAEVKRRGYAVMGAHHNHTEPVPPEQLVRSVNFVRNHPYESTRHPEKPQ